VQGKVKVKSKRENSGKWGRKGGGAQPLELDKVRSDGGWGTRVVTGKKKNGEKGGCKKECHDKDLETLTWRAKTTRCL